MKDKEDEKPAVRVVTKTPEEDRWGVYADQKVWLGDPKDRPEDVYIATTGDAVERPVNDNYVPVKFH